MGVVGVVAGVELAKGLSASLLASEPEGVAKAKGFVLGADSANGLANGEALEGPCVLKGSAALEEERDEPDGEIESRMLELAGADATANGDNGSAWGAVTGSADAVLAGSVPVDRAAVELLEASALTGATAAGAGTEGPTTAGSAITGAGSGAAGSATAGADIDATGSATTGADADADTVA